MVYVSVLCIWSGVRVQEGATCCDAMQMQVEMQMCRLCIAQDWVFKSQRVTGLQSLSLQTVQPFLLCFCFLLTIDGVVSLHLCTATAVNPCSAAVQQKHRYAIQQMQAEQLCFCILLTGCCFFTHTNKHSHTVLFENNNKSSSNQPIVFSLAFAHCCSLSWRGSRLQVRGIPRSRRFARPTELFIYFFSWYRFFCCSWVCPRRELKFDIRLGKSGRLRQEILLIGLCHFRNFATG